LGRLELAAKGLSPKPEDQRQLKDALKEAIARKTLSEWQALFDEQDACVEPVLTLREGHRASPDPGAPDGDRGGSGMVVPRSRSGIR